MKVGSKIRRMRLDMGLSQTQFVSGLIDRTYLSKIENDNVLPSLDTLRLLADRLGVSLADLLIESDFEKKLSRCKELLQRGQRTRDLKLIQESWMVAYQLKAVDEMLESVISWADLDRRSKDLVDALSTTIACAANKEPLNPAFWEVTIRLGNSYYALALYERAAWVFRDLISRCPLKETVIRSWINLGSCLLEFLDYENALSAFQHGIALWERTFELFHLARCHHGIGVCYRVLGDWGNALDSTIAAHQIYEYLGDDRVYETHHNVGILWLDRRNYPNALKHMSAALDHYLLHGLSEHVARIYEEYARLHFYQGEIDKAHEYCMKALTCIKGGHSTVSGHLFLWKTLLYVHSNELDRATESFCAALGLLGARTWPIFRELAPDLGSHVEKVRRRLGHLT